MASDRHPEVIAAILVVVHRTSDAALEVRRIAKEA
jgi:hypothetical protein